MKMWKFSKARGDRNSLRSLIAYAVVCHKQTYSISVDECGVYGYSCTVFFHNPHSDNRIKLHTFVVFITTANGALAT